MAERRERGRPSHAAGQQRCLRCCPGRRSHTMLWCLHLQGCPATCALIWACLRGAQACSPTPGSSSWTFSACMHAINLDRNSVFNALSLSPLQLKASAPQSLSHHNKRTHVQRQHSHGHWQKLTSAFRACNPSSPASPSMRVRPSWSPDCRCLGRTSRPSACAWIPGCACPWRPLRPPASYGSPGCRCLGSLMRPAASGCIRNCGCPRCSVHQPASRQRRVACSGNGGL